MKVRRRCYAWLALLGVGGPCTATLADSAPPPVEAEFSRPRPANVPADDELVALGATIGKIELDRRQVFDTTQSETDGWIFRAANRFHKLTRPSVIQTQLLFETGDTYDPREVEESERILRLNEFFFDAAIVPMAYNDGVVDLLVTTRDLWSIEPEISFSRSGGENQTVLGVEDENFLGTGALIGARVESDLDRDSNLFYFSDRQVGRRWLSVDASYGDNSDGTEVFLRVQRPFFALDTRRAGGLTTLHNDRVESLYRLGDEVVDYRQDESFFDAWVGWSGGLRNSWVRRWRLGIVHHDNRFAEPPNGVRAGPVPTDRKLVYPYISVDILEDEFIKGSNIEQISRTEDFYLGTRVSATVGYAGTSLGSDRSAWMLAATAQKGFGDTEKRMLLLNAETSGRIESGRTANAIIESSARYYHRLSPKWLRTISLQATKGINLDLDRPMQLGGDTGLRGYPVRYQSGDSRVLFSIEQRYFTDWYPWRIVRVGAAAFFDAGRSFGDNPIGGESLGWLRSVGVGLRLAPTRGSRKMFHIDVSFPLDGDSSIDSVQIDFQGRRSF